MKEKKKKKELSDIFIKIITHKSAIFKKKIGLFPS